MLTEVNFQNVNDLPPLETLFRPLAFASRIGIAVSGGADSLALMLLLRAWAKTSEKKLIVYTLDHQLRDEAASECAEVARLADALGLESRLLKWAGDKPSSGVPAAARRARYRLISEAMALDYTEVLTTGHHLQDQAETLLMRLSHGSGIGGLGGMSVLCEVENVCVCRPLLGVDKHVLETCVRMAGIVPVEDPSNQDRKYERTRWRNVLVTLADQGLSADRFGELAKRAERADTALERYARPALERLATYTSFGMVELSRPELRNLPEEIALRIMRALIDWAGAGSRPYALAPVEALTSHVRGDDVLKPTTLGGCLIRARREVIEIMRESARVSSAPQVLAPGETLIWDRRFSISNLSSNTALHVMAGHGMTRKIVTEQFKRCFDDPMVSVRSAPLVRDDLGEIVSIGCETRSGDVQVALNTKRR